MGDGRDAVEGQLGPLLLQHRRVAGRRDQPKYQSAVSDYNWTDANGNRIYQPGEETTLIQKFGGTSNVSIDSNLKNSFTDEASIFAEREVLSDLGVRVGFVYKKDNDGWQQVNSLRPFDAYNVPVSRPDPGRQHRRQWRRWPSTDAAEPRRSEPRFEPADDQRPRLRGQLQDARVRREQALLAPLVDERVVFVDVDQEYSRTYFSQTFATAVTNFSLFGAFPTNPNGTR